MLLDRVDYSRGTGYAVVVGMVNKQRESNKLVGIKFFVTGGAGFIGSHLVDELLSRGGQITVYDNLSSGKIEFLTEHFGKGNFRFIQGDLLDTKKLRASITDHSVVFHLAANPDISYGFKHTDWDLQQETIATYNVLEAMRLKKINKIAFASTSAIFGQAKVLPTPEDYGPLLPQSLYGANKLACEALISAYVHTFGFRAWIYRFANVVGSRATHGVIYDFLKQLKSHPNRLEMKSNGGPRKSYIYVEDCVAAMLKVFMTAKEPLPIYNLAATGQTTVNQIAGIIINEMKLTGVKIKRGPKSAGWPGDITEMNLSIVKLRQLGYRAEFTSTEAVRAAVRGLL